MAGRKMLGRLRAYIGTFAQAAVDQTGTMANFFDVRHNPLNVSPGYVMHPDQRATSLVYERPDEVHGFKTVQLDALSADLCGTGEELNVSATPTKTGQSKILEAVLGGYQSGGGSAVEASPSPSAQGFSVGSGHGTRFPAGQVIWVETTASSERFEAGKVASVSTDALTLHGDLSFTPVSTAKVLNSQMVFPTNAPSSVMQLLVEEEDRDAIWLLLAVQASGLDLNWPIGEKGSYSAPLMAASFVHDDDIATPQGGSALALATLSGGQPIVIKAGTARVGTVGGVDWDDLQIDSVSFSPNLQRVQVANISDLGGLNGIGGYEVVKAGAPPELVIEHPWVDEADIDTILPNDGDTLSKFLFQAGNVAGKQMCLEIAAAQLVGVEQFDKNGLHYVRKTFHCQLDSECTDQSTDIRRAPWRLAFG